MFSVSAGISLHALQSYPRILSPHFLQIQSSHLYDRLVFCEKAVQPSPHALKVTSYTKQRKRHIFSKSFILHLGVIVFTPPFKIHYRYAYFSACKIQLLR